MELRDRSRATPVTAATLALLLAAYALEAAVVGLALAFNKYLGHLSSLTTRQGLLIAAPAAAVLLSLAYIIGAYARARRSGLRPFAFTLAANVLGLAIVLASGEMVARAFSARTATGFSVAGIPLLPFSWADLNARNAELLQHAPPGISYFVSDTLLGWRVGPSRRSTDGMYLSSAEGIRSPRVGIAYAGHPTLHEIAIVGDSYTFGLEVPFEDSWGSQLERALGTGYQTLNFGTDGYGVDQAYLRYGRDVRPWHPAVTIFGFIQHDL
jgi:hypothetical protein